MTHEEPSSHFNYLLGSPWEFVGVRVLVRHSETFENIESENPAFEMKSCKEFS